MNIRTQVGQMNVNPADIISIKSAEVIPGLLKYSEFNYCVSLNDLSSRYNRRTVCISELDALLLSDLSGVKAITPGWGRKRKALKHAAFIPFQKLLTLNDWEKYFDSSLKDGINRQPKPVLSLPGKRSLYQENYQPQNAFEQIIERQFNCIGCGKLVYDESKACSSCLEVLGTFWK